MPIAGFSQLVAAVCELQGAPAPALTPSHDGIWSATVTRDGSELILMQVAGHEPGVVLLLAPLGPMPCEDDTALAAGLVLLDANLCFFGHGSPAFSRDPIGGAFLLQWPCSLDDSSVNDIHQRLTLMGKTAAAWRQGHFLHEPQAAHAWFSQAEAFMDCDSARQEAGRRHFRSMCASILTGLGQGEPAWPDTSQGCAVQLQVAGLDVTVAHVPRRDALTAWTSVHVGEALAAPDWATTAALLDANFLHLVHQCPARFSRGTPQGDVLLHFPHELTGTDADRWLSAVRLLADGAGTGTPAAGDDRP